MQSASRLKSVITTATGVALIYLVGIAVELRLELIFALYCLSLAATIWMVIRILKDPYSTDMTFDEYFYQDRPDIRRVGKE